MTNLPAVIIKGIIPVIKSLKDTNVQKLIDKVAIPTLYQNEFAWSGEIGIYDRSDPIFPHNS